MVLSALVTLLVTTAPEALGQPLLPSPLLAVIHEDAACDGFLPGIPIRLHTLWGVNAPHSAHMTLSQFPRFQ